MRLFGAPFSQFRELPQINILPPNQAKQLYDQINDLSTEMSWSAFAALPIFIGSSIEEITQSYRFYLNDRITRIAQLVQQQRDLKDGKEYNNVNLNQYNTLDWLTANARPGNGSSYSENAAPRHLLKEDGSDILLEDFGLILLEEDTP